jgi:hypothetical protein
MRAAFACGVCASVLVGAARVSTAQDVPAARQDVVSASDFRVRVAAALYLGKVRPRGARIALERALNDTHPAVRAAAAAALGSLGDSAAIAALERRSQAESSPSVRAQVQTSLEQLRTAPPVTVTAAVVPAADRVPIDKARYVVRFGDMRNNTGVAGDNIDVVMRDAARQHRIPGALVVDESDDATLEAARSKHIPIFLLDGALTRLAQARQGGGIGFQAQVEFSVRQVPEHTLKGMLSGAATSVDPAANITENRKRELQTLAVGGAVESALRGADQGLALVAK